MAKISEIGHAANDMVFHARGTGGKHPKSTKIPKPKKVWGDGKNKYRNRWKYKIETKHGVRYAKTLKEMESITGINYSTILNHIKEDDVYDKNEYKITREEVAVW